MEQPGLLDHAVLAAESGYRDAPSYIEGVITASALLLHGISSRQAFRDGNRRTAYSATRVFLANCGLGYVSDLKYYDHMLVRYLNGTVESHQAQYPCSQYYRLLQRRVINRRRVG